MPDFHWTEPKSLSNVKGKFAADLEILELERRLKLLEELFVNNQTFEALETELKTFCPFEAIGMVSQEIRHCYFLSYLLDPNRPHGFGAAYTRALLSLATREQRVSDASSGRSLTPIDIHLMDLENVRVRREWRKIDLLIEIPDAKTVIAIEVKVDASESDGQLNVYQERVHETWPEWNKIFLFLTKSGDQPSDENWISIELSDLANAFEHSSKKELGSLYAREVLQSYLSMLRRHHLSNTKLEAVASELWSKHKDALDYLMDQRPDEVGDAFRMLYEERAQLAEKLSHASELRIVPDDSSPRLLRFAVSDWDDIDLMMKAKWTGTGRLLLLEVERVTGTTPKARFRFVLGPGPEEARRSVYEVIEKNSLDKAPPNGITPSYRRMQSETISSETEEIDAVAFKEKITAALEKYAAKKMRKFDLAINMLRKQI